MTLILVPYRDRQNHLLIFIRDLCRIFHKHIPNVKIVIIEQTQDNKKFNRGKLLNVGFLEYYKQFDYFFTHDIDRLPFEKTIINKYNNKEFDIERFDGGIGISLGGICKFKSQIFKDINGFPNDIWGWGLEDEALYTRARFKNCKISELPGDSKPQFHSFVYLPHRSSCSNPNLENDFYINNKKTGSSCIWRWGTEIKPNQLTNEQKNRFLVTNGLDDINYKIINKEIINDYIEKIIVEI
jgi:beta-1,4-galactosyltransferase 1